MNAARDRFPLRNPEIGVQNTDIGQAGDEKPSLLVVDDDEGCCWAMRRAFEQRGYGVRVAHSVPEAMPLVEESCPDFALVDLRMPGPSGLALVARIKEVDPAARVVVLTGYSSIATAVDAIKLGASDYLVKPVDAAAVEAAFQREADGAAPAPKIELDDAQILSVDRLAWEHIQRTLSQNGGNVSATARALGMHRRTLQRKLNKHPARR
jgi:two-component system response regulator RegA